MLASATRQLASSVARQRGPASTSNWLLNGPKLLLSTSREPEQPKQRYIDKVLKELKDRGLKDNSDISNQNAFQLFKLEQQYAIDVSKLRREMRSLQRLLHPDLFVCKDKESQDKADQLSALVNQAHDILNHPYKRAKYLLALAWNNSPQEIETKLDELKLSPEFLAKMMQIRETIETEIDKKTLSKIAADVDMELDLIVSRVDSQFKEKNYDSILESIGKLKFVANCHSIVEKKIGSFGNF